MTQKPCYSVKIKIVFKAKYVWLSILWLLVISNFFVWKNAPESLHADTMMHSIISLQNVTLYYWGQNRLLNILPLLISPINNPTGNLIAVLLISSITFFAFLLLIARYASLMVSHSVSSLETLKIFIVISAVFITVFKPSGASEIAIGHIEYSLPALLFGLSIYFVLFNNFESGWKYFFTSGVIFLAIGINPAIWLVSMFVTLVSVIYKKKISKGDIVLLFISIISFIFWSIISKQYENFLYENLPYNVFSIKQLPNGLEKVIYGLVHITNLATLLFLLFLILLWQTFKALSKSSGDGVDCSICRYTNCAIVLFSMSWLSLFSSSKWIEMNAFGWRYFIYIIFAALLALAIEVGIIFNRIGRKFSLATVIMFSIVTLALTYATPASFNNYTVFQTVNALLPAEGGLYAGDYWVAWPAVLRDLMSGRESYGVGPRGESNREKARNYVASEIKNNGFATIKCLNEKEEVCVSQSRYVLGSISVKGFERRKDGVVDIMITDLDVHDYRGDKISSLYSNTGILSNGQRETNGTQGFLVYGPYVPVTPGNYLLKVYGNTGQIKSAFIDVVSRRAQVIHAKFNFTSNKTGVLLDGAPVYLPAFVSDLQMRIWVDETDQLSFRGYTLDQANLTNKALQPHRAENLR